MAKFDIIAATGCPTGIAHTFMAKEALEKAGAVDGDEIRICGRAFEFESTRTAADLFEELDI